MGQVKGVIEKLVSSRHAGKRDIPQARNPWEVAAEKQKQRDKKGGQQEGGTENNLPWQIDSEPPRKKAAQKGARGVVWLVVGLAAFTGVREWISGDEEKSTRVIKAQNDSFPEDEARAVASRFTRAYLTWNEDAPEERESRLGADLSKGQNASLGWNGNGIQEAVTVQPGKVTKRKAGRARVEVDALVKNKEKKSDTGSWVRLDVPVIEVKKASRIVVTGAPGVLGVPMSAPKAPDDERAEADQELTAETSGTVKKFFEHYADGEPENVTAPGASIPSLPKEISLEGVEWAVDKGKGEERTGTAQVTWSMSGAEVEQEYRVTITQVASNDASRWQVSEIHGGG